MLRLSRSLGLPARAPDRRRLRFAPGHTGGGLREAGPFQGWRRASYPASHVGPDA